MSDTTNIKRRTDSEEAKRFWDSADKARAEFESRPTWKKAQLDELKPLPCPFCGSQSVLQVSYPPTVVCKNCTARVLGLTAWNRRVTNQEDSS